MYLLTATANYFVKKKVHAPHVFVHIAKLTNTGDIRMRLIANHTTVWCPSACLENEVVNPAFDTIRIRDELIYQTNTGYFL